MVSTENKTVQPWKELPELVLNLKDSHDDLYKLLEEIKPAWKKYQVRIKALSGGNSSYMYRCSHESGDAITVRVKKAHFDGMKDPKCERQVVTVLSSKGYFPPLLAMFQDGFCYEYIKGRPAVMPDTPNVHIDDEQLRLIAEMLANIHAVVIPGFGDHRGSYFDFFVGLLDSCTPFFEGCPPIAMLQDEVRFVEEVVSEVGSPLVLTHADLHPANMVWNEEERKITFVDWESVQIAPRGVDIAWFLTSFEHIAAVLSIPATKPADAETKFCVHYLKRWHELHDKPFPTEMEIDHLLLEMKHYSLVTALARLIIVVKFTEKLVRYGKLESLWQITLERYTAAKDKLLGINKIGRN